LNSKRSLRHNTINTLSIDLYRVLSKIAIVAYPIQSRIVARNQDKNPSTFSSSLDSLCFNSTRARYTPANQIISSASLGVARSSSMNSCRSLVNSSRSTILQTLPLYTAIPKCTPSRSNSSTHPRHSFPPFASCPSLRLASSSLTFPRFSSTSSSSSSSSRSTPLSPRPKPSQSIFSKLLRGSSPSSPSPPSPGTTRDGSDHSQRDLEMAKALERTLRGRGMGEGNMDVRCTTLDKT